ncbi:beta strand repeat-containing protein [Duganella vulcania]|uniref:beta strand repeat-containing protein n=1 Tax=Duganella vulcania TaxID=2692166 RepID=UPI0015828617|nr:Ig-like domain-containing protein [Duganella vulcania]
MKKITGWLAMLACASVLSACGGGGGSAGANSNGVAPSKAASVVLTASATTIASSGLDGTEVTLTAIVRDAGGNALPNETVNFSASSGTVSSTNRVTNASGQVVEKLSVKGDSTPRTITISASAANGAVKSSELSVAVITAVPSLTLTTDSGTLASVGTAGNEVNVVALVRDSNNTVMSGVTVDLKADSGSLSLTNRVSNAQGIVTEKLGTGGDPTSRAIKITASAPGAAPVTAIVNVAGNKLTINAQPTINVGASADVTVKLVDSAGNGLSGKTVTYSSNSNGLTVKGGGAAVTNSAGQLVLSYTASSGSSDLITVKAAGETNSVSIAINSSSFAVKVLDAGGNAESSAFIGGCQRIAVTGGPVPTPPATASVTISSSRGVVYSDPACTTVLSTTLPLAGGAATAYVNATGPGVATITAAATGGLTTQTDLEFVAPLTNTAIITIQADPAVIGVNNAGSTSQQSTLRAVVRDGTVQNNVVKNATVAFSIQSDATAGTLTQPAVVVTGADGAATVSFIAGANPSPLNGVKIQAKIIGGSGASAIASLTVAQKSLFISAGTGSTVGQSGTAAYQLDYVVLVTDAAGNAVSGVKLTASVLPVTYFKGFMKYTLPLGPWEPVQHVGCANEDINRDGILDAGEDLNGNGVLDPGIPVTVTTNITTDAKGQAIVSLVYPRDRANWLDVNLTVRGQANGSESSYTGLVHLPGLGVDYATQAIQPPGVSSPYGISTLCSNPN